MKKFFANGKLLISGEYVVLEGAKSLAVPTKKGQSLIFKESSNQTLNWNSLNLNNKTWFEAILSADDLSVIKTSDAEKAQFLQSLLKNAKKLSSNKFNPSGEVVTKLQFPRNWGFGSSSTLISCVAQWFEIDAFDLHFSVSNGSGYDVACANSKSSIAYTLVDNTPKYSSIKWNPSFKDFLFFVHLNTKQNSFNEVVKYQLQKNVKKNKVDEITELTDKIISCEDLDDFRHIIETHEKVISETIGKPTIKDRYFDDFNGTIKSLGAWGGDFILVVGKQKERDYFSKKGFSTQLNFKDTII